MSKGQFQTPINVVLTNTNKLNHHLSQIENFDAILARGEGAKLDSNNVSMTNRRAAEIATVKSLVSEIETAMTTISALSGALA